MFDELFERITQEIKDKNLRKNGLKKEEKIFSYIKYILLNKTDKLHVVKFKKDINIKYYITIDNSSIVFCIDTQHVFYIKNEFGTLFKTNLSENDYKDINEYIYKHLNICEKDERMNNYSYLMKKLARIKTT